MTNNKYSLGRFLKIRLLLAIGIAAWLSACATTQQEAGVSDPPQAAETAVVEEVLVTGSYVKRDGFTRAERRRHEREAALARLNEKARQVESAREQRPDLTREEILSRRLDPTMVFKHYGVNPTVETLVENVTTFSIDVDTASYNLTKAFLERNNLPDPAAIRVEEFVNALDYGYRRNTADVFEMHAEAFPSEFRRGFHVLHLGLKAQDAIQTESKRANLTFLVDVSGSMGAGNRLEIVKESLLLLMDELSRDDIVSIVAYTNDASLVLEPTEVRHRGRIVNAIRRLHPQGGTNIEAGIQLAYRMANKSYDPARANRIILCSDGVANIGRVKADDMMQSVSSAAKRGIYLNTVGVGMGNYNDVTLETLAKEGQGQYTYINTLDDARRVFVDHFAGSLHVVARDVRIQAEFDPEVVESYRLLGYENRGMDNADFNNARKDAGEVGAGHAVTAIYEMKFRDGVPQQEFGVLRVNFKKLDSESLNLIERALPAGIIASSRHRATANTQLSYIAAAFAEKLRCSYWSRTYSYEELERWLRRIDDEVADPDGARELLALIDRAGRLDRRADPYDRYISVERMSFDRVPVLKD